VQNLDKAYTLPSLDHGRRHSGIEQKRRSGECECVLHVGVDAVKQDVLVWLLQHSRASAIYMFA
jgi:hypothetical protein